jgi:UDPglucose 6-dehydrogenase
MAKRSIRRPGSARKATRQPPGIGGAKRRSGRPTSGPAIGIVGLGYVGVGTAIAFAEYGRPVFGFDISSARRRELGSGNSPFHEPGLPAHLARVVRSGRFHVVESLEALVRPAELLFLCVPTPSLPDGSVDLRYLQDAAQSIGRALRNVPKWRAVIVKSTAVPGTTLGTVKPILLESSGKAAPTEVGVGANPEFLAEGQLLHDALFPARIVLGTEDARTARALTRAYRGFPAPLIRLSPDEAELVKYTSNALLATKVSFANEIGRLASAAGLDIYPVMEAVGLDPRLGKGFLRVGPGFGGSCFGKDLRALISFASTKGVVLEIPKAVLSVNASQAIHVVDRAEREAGSLRDRHVALLGLTFKPETSDIRESQAYPILEELLRRGASVRVHDPVGAEAFRHGLDPAMALRTGERLVWAPSLQAALSGADLAVIQCDWQEYRRAPPSSWGGLRLSLVVDARRTLDPDRLKRVGVRYVAVGR